MQTCGNGTGVVLPPGWGWRPAGAIDLTVRSEASSSREAVREALSRGTRLFLLGAEGAARRAGWLVATDHIRFFGDSPLVGPERDVPGQRFASLSGLYRSPEGPWRRGVVCRVPDWRASTPAELRAMRAAALVSEGVDEAIMAGHGGASVLLLVRCHAWGSWNCSEPPVDEALRALTGGETK